MSDTSENPQSQEGRAPAAATAMAAPTPSAASAAPAPVSQGPSRPGSPWLAALGRVLRQPRFVVAALVLGVSAAALNGATQFMQLHFRKEAVPLPVKGLADESEGVPARLGPWAQVSRDEPLDPEMEGFLGTRQYVIRQYVDTRLVPHAVADFKNLSDQDRHRKLAEIQAEFARRAGDEPAVPVLTFQMTYYTGLVDTVAHIPDRCYVADGFEPSSYEVASAPGAGFADGKRGTRCDVPFRFISFEDQTGQGRVGRFVGYFFQVNGEYSDDPLAVRGKLQRLLERYGYYSKIELMAQSIDPRLEQSAAYHGAVERAMKDFIAAGLPEIEKRLPDWQLVKAKK